MCRSIADLERAEIIKRVEDSGADLAVHRLKNCKLYIQGSLAALRVEDCHGCTLMMDGQIAGSTFCTSKPAMPGC